MSLEKKKKKTRTYVIFYFLFFFSYKVLIMNLKKKKWFDRYCGKPGKWNAEEVGDPDNYFINHFQLAS